MHQGIRGFLLCYVVALKTAVPRLRSDPVVTDTLSHLADGPSGAPADRTPPSYNPSPTISFPAPRDQPIPFTTWTDKPSDVRSIVAKIRWGLRYDKRAGVPHSLPHYSWPQRLRHVLRSPTSPSSFRSIAATVWSKNRPSFHRRGPVTGEVLGGMGRQMMPLLESGQNSPKAHRHHMVP